MPKRRTAKNSAREAEPSAGTDPSYAENAVAAAAAASFRLLKPVALESDEISSGLAWRDDIDRLDETFGARLPGIESLSRIVPAGDPRALWRYLYFEFASRPERTDPGRLLKAVAAALSTRAKSTATIGVGPILMGPLGVIRLSRCSWTGVRVAAGGTYAAWESDVRGGQRVDWDLSLLRQDRKTGVMDGWSDRWRRWLQEREWIHAEGTGGDWFISDAPRLNWSPDDAPVPIRFRSSIENLWLKRDVVRELLDESVREFKGAFLGGVDYSLSSKAKDALEDDRIRSKLTKDEAWHLLHVVPAESLIDLGRRRGLVVPETERSFAEELAQALIDAGDLTGSDSWLRPFLGHAGGPLFDRVLHYLLRAGPANVLKGHIAVSIPIACSLARITCAPLRFRDESKWDPTSEDEQVLLARSVSEALGCEQLPQIDPRARPIRDIRATRDVQQVETQVMSGRKRAEWILQTANRYIYHLKWRCTQISTRQATGVAISDVAHYDCDESLESWAKSKDLRLHGLSLSGLVDLNQYLCSKVSDDDPAHLREIAEAHKQLRAWYGQMKVAQAGNLGAHANRASIDRLSEASMVLREFDELARKTPRVLPGLARFVEERRKADYPLQVTVEPIDELGIDLAKRVHYFSTNAGASRLRGDRILSFTDVTCNTISVNPIVIDWTDWLKEPIAPRQPLE